MGTPAAIRNAGTRSDPIWWSIVHVPDADMWLVVHEAAGAITVHHRAIDPAYAISRANALLGPDVMPFADDEITGDWAPPLQETLWA